jgi:hypothetical protein
MVRSIVVHPAYRQVDTSESTFNAKLMAVGSAQPDGRKSHEPSSYVAKGAKFGFRESMQPAMLHVPSSSFARELKLSAELKVHPFLRQAPVSTVASLT